VVGAVVVCLLSLLVWVAGLVGSSLGGGMRCDVGGAAVVVVGWVPSVASLGWLRC
jgi:hypothetical protein